MIGSRHRTEALQTMEMWQKIMPEDEDIRAGWYLAREIFPNAFPGKDGKSVELNFEDEQQNN